MGCLQSKPAEDNGPRSAKHWRRADRGTVGASLTVLTASSHHSSASVSSPTSAASATRTGSLPSAGCEQRGRRRTQRGSTKMIASAEEKPVSGDGVATCEASGVDMELCLSNDSAAIGGQCDGDGTGPALMEFSLLETAPTSTPQGLTPARPTVQAAANGSSPATTAATSGTGGHCSSHNAKETSCSAVFLGLTTVPLSPRTPSRDGTNANQRRTQVCFSGVAEFSLDSSANVSTSSLHRHRVLHVPAGGGANGKIAPSGPMPHFQPPSFLLHGDGMPPTPAHPSHDHSSATASQVAAACLADGTPLGGTSATAVSTTTRELSSTASSVTSMGDLLGDNRSLTTESVRGMVLMNASGSATEGVHGRQQSHNIGSVVVPMFDPTDRESIQLQKQHQQQQESIDIVGGSSGDACLAREVADEAPTPVLHRDQIAHSRKHKKRNGAGRRGSRAATTTTNISSRRQSALLPPFIRPAVQSDARSGGRKRAQTLDALSGNNGPATTTASSAPTLRPQPRPPRPLSPFALALTHSDHPSAARERLKEASSWSPTSQRGTPPTDSMNPLQLPPPSSPEGRALLPPQHRGGGEHPIQTHDDRKKNQQQLSDSQENRTARLSASLQSFLARPHQPSPHSGTAASVIAIRRRQREQRQQQQVSSVPSSAIVAARCMVTSQQQQQSTPTINSVRRGHEEDGFARLQNLQIHHATEERSFDDDSNNDECPRAFAPPAAASCSTPPPPPDHHDDCCHCGDASSHRLVMGDETVD